MSTNINISVGDSKLLDQARLQQNASRQAQLEKEANKRLSNEAEINRVNALAAQGKDSNGNTITAPGTGPKPLRDEPAAFRSGDPYFFVLGPNTAPTPSVLVSPIVGVYGEDKYAASTRIEPAFSFQEVWPGIVPPFNTPENQIFAEFKENLGPSGLNGVMFNTTQSANLGVSYSLGMYYESKYNESTGQQDFFARAKQLNTTDYTVEAYFRLDTPVVNFFDEFQGSYQDTVITFSVAAQTTEQVAKKLISIEFELSRFLAAPRCRCFYVDYANQDNTFTSGLLTQSDYSFGSWKHFALCRSGNTVRFFVGGVNVYQVNSSLSTEQTNDGITAQIGADISRAKGLEGNVPSSPWFSRAKYSQRALYTNNFTPPTTW